MKKQILFYAVLFFITSFIYVGCKKKSDDNATPTTPATSGATCSDGIQNQGETGIDCGGPCTACAVSASMSYKFNGTLITEENIAAVRDTTKNPRILTITGAKTAAPYYPTITIKISETFIGFVDGLNITCDYLSEPDQLVTMIGSTGTSYTTAIATAGGLDFYYSKLSYVNGATVTGIFSGQIENSSGTSFAVTEGTFSVKISN